MFILLLVKSNSIISLPHLKIVNLTFVFSGPLILLAALSILISKVERLSTLIILSPLMIPAF